MDERRRRRRPEGGLKLGVGAGDGARGEGVGDDEDRTLGGRESGLVSGEIGERRVVNAEIPQSVFGQPQRVPGPVAPGDCPGDPRPLRRRKRRA